MAFPNNMLRIRDNAIVRPLNIPPDKLREFNEFVASKKHTSMIKREEIKKLAGRGCCVCGTLPSFEVIYQLQDAKRIERYCDSCIQKVFTREAEG